MKSLSFYWGLSLVAAICSGVFLSFAQAYILWIPLGACLAIGNLMRRNGRRAADTMPDTVS